MSIRFKNGRPIVEVYDPATRTKRYVKPADYDMTFKGLTGRQLERAAKTLEAKAMEDRAEQRPSRGDESCDSFAGRWIADFPRRGAGTNLSNGERVSRFADDFKGRTLNSVTRQDARAWARQYPARLPAVRAMYNDAIQEGVARHNPFAALGIERSKGREDIIVLTVEDIDRLRDIAVRVLGRYGGEFAAVIGWGAYTCMRPGEICAARHTQLDGDLYHVDRQWHSKLRREADPKHNSKGWIYVPAPALQAVNGLPRRLGDDLMFRTTRGKQLSDGTLNYYWRKVRDAFTASLPTEHPVVRRLDADPDDHLDFYELRHFGASFMLNELQIEPWIIAEQLRHSDGGKLVIRLYGHPDRRKALDRIRRAYGNNVAPLRPASGDIEGTRAAEGA